MRYHLFQKFFGKMVKIKETSFLSIRGMTLMFGNCSIGSQKSMGSIEPIEFTLTLPLLLEHDYNKFTKLAS